MRDDHLRNGNLPTLPGEERGFTLPAAVPYRRRQRLLQDDLVRPFGVPSRDVPGDRLIRRHSEHLPACRVDEKHVSLRARHPDKVRRRLEDPHHPRAFAPQFIGPVLHGHVVRHPHVAGDLSGGIAHRRAAIHDPAVGSVVPPHAELELERRTRGERRVHRREASLAILGMHPLVPVTGGVRDRRLAGESQRLLAEIANRPVQSHAPDHRRKVVHHRQIELDLGQAFGAWSGRRIHLFW